jgi:hypothetical protein
MKISIPCIKCNKENLVSDFQEEIFKIKSVPSDFTIRLKCKNNHLNIIHLSDPLFSILFDKSVTAFLEENYRGCIFESASSLERFYEHTIRVLLIEKKDFENKVIVENFNNSWKIIRNMSERQIGAFIMLFHKTTHKTPILLNENLTKLRNSVIHKGYLPEKKEALQFLENVYALIQTNRQIIGGTNPELYWLLDQRIDFENFINPPELKSEEYVSMSYSGAHFFNSAFGGDTFEESIKRYYNDKLL